MVVDGGFVDGWLDLLKWAVHGIRGKVGCLYASCQDFNEFQGSRKPLKLGNETSSLLREGAE